MGLLLAQAPFEDFARENAPLLGLLVCAILALLVVRLITRTLTRFLMLSILALVCLFVVVERDAITECAQTCECEIGGADIDVPYCNRELPRTGQ